MTYDIAIIGGGIVGLATARAILDRAPRTRLVLLEKETDIAHHQTGHNSGVIHSGIYYKPGSYKARLCVEGARLMKAYCEKNGIEVDTCGKVIVATSQEELPRLKTLYERGVANGVPGVAMIDARRLKEIEPHASALAGIHSPQTAIVDYRRVAETLARDLVASGLTLERSFRVGAITRERGTLRLATLGFSGFRAMAKKYWKTGAYEMYRSLSKRAFVKALQRLVPALAAEDIRPGGAGVRAQAVTAEGALVDDFRIVQTADAVHVLNAPSPAATASLAIGRHIATIAAETFQIATRT